MNVLDLFSGIGGFSLGLERAGMRTVAFCEIDPYCRRVLARHWPDVPVYGDIRDLTAAKIMADAIGLRELQSQRGEQDERRRTGHGGIDVICGGFPCQDISVAGKGVGIEGERSGLWKEYARIIGEVRPRYVVVENVAALLNRGLDVVLADLAALGYDAEWHCIPAAAVGAPHRRDRVWIIAYPGSGELWQQSGRGHGTNGSGKAFASINGEEQSVADPARELLDRSGEAGSGWWGQSTNGSGDVADADQPRLQGRIRKSLRECAEQRFAWAGGFQGWDEGKWFTESGMGRISNGVPARVDRLRSLGNAVVPQIVEIIGRAIMKAAGH